MKYIILTTPETLTEEAEQVAVDIDNIAIFQGIENRRTTIALKRPAITVKVTQEFSQVMALIIAAQNNNQTFTP